MYGISYSITLYTPVSAVFNNLKNWATARLWATAKFAVDHNDREGCFCDPGVHRLWWRWKKLEGKEKELIDRSKNRFYVGEISIIWLLRSFRCATGLSLDILPAIKKHALDGSYIFEVGFPSQGSATMTKLRDRLQSILFLSLTFFAWWLWRSSIWPIMLNLTGW